MAGFVHHGRASTIDLLGYLRGPAGGQELVVAAFDDNRRNTDSFVGAPTGRSRRLRGTRATEPGGGNCLPPRGGGASPGGAAPGGRGGRGGGDGKPAPGRGAAPRAASRH